MEVYEKVENVARIIGVAPSTVKKYYALFEQEGFRFKRSNEGYVLFSNHDIDLLKELMVLKNQPEMTVLKAVKQLVKNEGITSTTDMSDTTNTTDITDMSDTTSIVDMANQVTTVMADIAELKQLVKDQNELIRQQQAYIDEKLEKQGQKSEERHQVLVESLRTSMELRKALIDAAATKEQGEPEEKEQQQEKEQGFFRRLFGKKQL